MSVTGITERSGDLWNHWQHEVLQVIRRDYEELLADVEKDDVDWDAWRPFFDEGRSPRAAVDRAFVRDL